MTKGKIKKSKDRGQWVVDPDGRKAGRLELNIGDEEDLEAARLLGATASEVIEFSIHRHLDQLGVPRDGRDVHVDSEDIVIDMPTGWEIVGP